MMTNKELYQKLNNAGIAFSIACACIAFAELPAFALLSLFLAGLCFVFAKKIKE